MLDFDGCKDWITNGDPAAAEHAGEMSGHKMDAETFATMAEYIDAGVWTAMAELVAAAKSFGQDTVPVWVLEGLIGTRSTAANMMFAAAEHLGIELTADVPDDISGLFDE